jgi:aspartate racemase
VQGRCAAASRDACRSIIARLVANGAQAVILGCTELMLLVHPEDSTVPLFDTTGLHAEAAALPALATWHAPPTIKSFLLLFFKKEGLTPRP